jgi:subtilisin family serine protease
MGTIAGAGGIGVAPDATWISCKGCRSSNCPQADLLACFQFMTCPTNPAGTTKDCTQAPRLVSNSWGGGQGSTVYNSAINAWRTAGIIPIFANGNSGPSCRTANSPGDNANVIAVGATDSSDKLASFSSKGPSTSGLVKPEVSAPGVSVRSAWNTGASAFNSISGTSMATPHVAGAVALLLSYKPNLTFAQIRTALTTTAARNLPASGSTCGSTADSVSPNNQYGYGRIDVLAAFNSL